MLKKILFTFFILIFSLFGQSTFAASISVESVFSDITSDYKYLNELQTLYDKGMISPDNNGKFNPNALLNRDEFVGILMEVTCRKCIQPNAIFDLVNKYSNSNVFFDINKQNQYFYCVAEASDLGYVNGYQEGSSCVDGTVKEGEKPFCSANTIIVEEAIAIILRASGILTNEEADEIRQDIYDGKITESISDDVSPKNIDGSVYAFYPDLRKALEYEVKDVDINGNITTYNLLELTNGKIRPKKAISKEEFLRIAFVTLKANSCETKTDNNIGLQIISDKINDDTYDFEGDAFSTCEAGIAEPTGYIWRFYNTNSGEEIKKYGEKIENYNFLSNGKWKVFLRVIDKCGNTGEVNNIINIKNGLNVSIIANPIYGNAPLIVDFEGIVSGGKGPYKYSWDFGNGNTGFGKKPQNLYKKEGVYLVTLDVIDINGKEARATTQGTVLINVLEDGKIEINKDFKKTFLDYDNDGVKDINDLCPLIAGDIKNKGCPIYEKACLSDNNCSEGTFCSENNVCIPQEVASSCEYTGGDIIIGNVSCNSCPCNNFLDFTSTLRKCDIIFPAITSPDSSTIYSKGELFQIK